MTRIRTYLNRLRGGSGDNLVLSPARVENLEAIFKSAYDTRNALFHRDDDTPITDGLIESLESGLFELIVPEVARVRAS